MQWAGPLQELVESRLGFREVGAHLSTVIVPWLEERAVETGSPPLSVVDRLIRAPDDDPELLALIDRVTINETSFMRHRAQLEAVVGYGARRYERLERPLQIWCAGCSTGEEAWSVAMLFDAAGIPVDILATDVGERVLSVARDANAYVRSTILHLTEEERQRYLVPRGDRFAVIARITERITLLRHNLFAELAPRPAVGDWDLILCRNVFIYFTDVAMAAAVRQMNSVLAPGGALVLGASDTIAMLDVPLQSLGLGIHRTEDSTRDGDGPMTHEDGGDSQAGDPTRGKRAWTNYFRSSS